MIHEGEAKGRQKIYVANSVIDPASKISMCRVMNTSDKDVRVDAGNIM